MGLASSSPVVLTAVTSGASFSRSFSVKVTQIECDSLSKGMNNIVSEKQQKIQKLICRDDFQLIKWLFSNDSLGFSDLNLS